MFSLLEECANDGAPKSPSIMIMRASPTERVIESLPWLPFSSPPRLFQPLPVGGGGFDSPRLLCELAWGWAFPLLAPAFIGCVVRFFLPPAFIGCVVIFLWDPRGLEATIWWG